MTGEDRTLLENEMIAGLVEDAETDRALVTEWDDTLPSIEPTSTHTGEDRTTPRPWKLRAETFFEDGVVSHEWHLDHGRWKSAVTVYGNESPEWDAMGEANAALIVEAVNNYDRLRRVLETIRETGLLDADEWLWLDKEIRAALEGAPHE